MKSLTMRINAKTIVFVAIAILYSFNLRAQFDTNPDSSNSNVFGIDTSSTPISESGPPQPVKKPYIRFVVPFDTITELVTYLEVVTDDESPGNDSLYARAKRWIRYEFGKSKQKQVIKKDLKKEYKLVLECEFPLYIETNKYSKTQNGRVAFDMEIRFKEDRYRYKINNLVHIVDPPPGEEKEIRTYFEFYRKSNINPKGNDMILMAADKKINKMIKDLKKFCKGPIFVDEDDW
ncbi:MAG: DUF4468 domain-containing protein [Bacteroidetes bacterium]|nr:DUF4468 domain-containing protein [Bacteroidota bacterium]